MRQQYISRVRFSETIQRMYEDGARIFVEVGPGGVLTGFVGDILRDKPHLALATDTRRAPGFEQLLSVLGQLFVNQVPLDVAALYAAHGADAPQPAKAPFLESALPFVRLDADEAARVRDILTGVMPAVAPPPADAGRVQAPPASESPVLSDHFRLMDDFLTSQANVSHLAIAGERNASDAPVTGWSGCLPLPFPAAVEFVGLDASPDSPISPAALRQFLGRSDVAYFDRDIVNRGRWRQRDWLLGRIAARRALAAWLSAIGGEPDDDDPDIDYDAEGRPILTSGPFAGTVFLSVSHKDGVAVCAASDRPLGIDLERFTSVRDPAGLARIAFSAAKSGLLADAGWTDSAADRDRLVRQGGSREVARAEASRPRDVIRDHRHRPRASNAAPRSCRRLDRRGLCRRRRLRLHPGRAGHRHRSAPPQRSRSWSDMT